MPYAGLSPARFGLLCKSGTGFAVLVSLLFVGMATPSLAQSPLAIPSNLGSAALLAPGPPRVTVHPRPHFYRREGAATIGGFGRPQDLMPVHCI
jgi:hypothetical protein